MSPNSLDPRSPAAYRRRARPFIFVGYILAVAGLSAIFSPPPDSQTTVAQLVSPTADLTWQVAYALGGILIAFGALLPRPDIEGWGLWLAIFALLVNLLALLAVRGVAGAGLAPAAYVLTLWIVYSRIVDLHTAARTERRAGPRHGPEFRQAPR